MTNKRKAFTTALTALVAGLVTFSIGMAIVDRPIRATTDSEKSSTSVMILRNPGGGGGTGEIIESGSSESKVLTNLHVCRAIAKGGVVVTESGARHQVSSYQESKENDLCLVTVPAKLSPAVRIAGSTPDLYSPAAISGHPHLVPNVISRGHFSGHAIIEVMTGLKTCTPEDLEKNPELAPMCFLLGGIPQFRSYEAQLATATISPGSSGSAVFNDSGEIAGVAFAASGDFNYAWIMPWEAVRNFLDREIFTADRIVINNERSLLDAESRTKSVDYGKAQEYCAESPNLSLAKKFCKSYRNDMIEGETE